jgi:hypothetical protein
MQGKVPAIIAVFGCLIQLSPQAPLAQAATRQCRQRRASPVFWDAASRDAMRLQVRRRMRLTREVLIFSRSATCRDVEHALIPFIGIRLYRL